MNHLQLFRLKFKKILVFSAQMENQDFVTAVFEVNGYFVIEF